MKKKNVKTKKKVFQGRMSSGPVGEDKVEIESTEPSTLISGIHSVPRKGKKTQKKRQSKQLLKSEKALVKLEKEIEKLKLDDVYYDSFISCMHQWLKKNTIVVKEMCKCIDVEGEGLLSFDEFKAGLLNLNAPVSKVELHLLCKLLDEDDSGEINYSDLVKGLQYAREVREINRQRVRDGQQLLLTERKFPTCSCCTMSIVEPWKETVPKYIQLQLQSVTFDKYHDYPGHLQLLVHSHLPICGLIQMIIAETDISSTKLAVFRDKSRSAESVLNPDMTLEEAGFLGDIRDSPEEVTLFYDYAVEFNDCPILLCDHYFRQKDQN